MKVGEALTNWKGCFKLSHFHNTSEKTYCNEFFCVYIFVWGIFWGGVVQIGVQISKKTTFFVLQIQRDRLLDFLSQALELPQGIEAKISRKMLRHFCFIFSYANVKLWNPKTNITERQFPKDPLVCPKKGIISTILWPVDGILNIREGSGFFGAVFFFRGPVVYRFLADSCANTEVCQKTDAVFLGPSNASPRHVPTPNLRSTCSWWSYEARVQSWVWLWLLAIYQVPSNLRETEQQKLENSLLITYRHRS